MVVVEHADEHDENQNEDGHQSGDGDELDFRMVDLLVVGVPVEQVLAAAAV